MILPWKSSLALVVVTLCSAGCNAQRTADPHQLTAEDVSTTNLSGVWVIDQVSIERFLHARYRKYTNRTDHVILLNSDGSCVYRHYSHHDPFISSDAQEDGLYSAFWGQAKYRTWYAWEPEASLPLTGPFASNVAASNRALFTNPFQRWRVHDEQKENLIEGSNLPRFWIWLYNSPKDSIRDHVNYWRIKKDADQLVLYNIVRNIGEIRFEKLSANEFVTLVRTEHRFRGNLDSASIGP